MTWTLELYFFCRNEKIYGVKSKLPFSKLIFGKKFFTTDHFGNPYERFLGNIWTILGFQLNHLVMVFALVNIKTMYTSDMGK